MSDLNLKISNVQIKKLNYCQPTKFYQKFKSFKYSSLLTGKGNQDIAGRSIIGIKPHTLIKIGEKIEIEQERDKFYVQKDMWKFLKIVLKQTEYHKYKFPINRCGGIGYISYEIAHKIEKLPKNTVDNYFSPLFMWIFYNEYYYFDEIKKELFQIKIDYVSQSIIDEREDQEDIYCVEDVKIGCTKQEYLAKVEKIRDYIFNGDVYEVNLTEQISGNFQGNAYTFFQRLFEINDAPFSAFLNFGDLKVVSNSPELFLKGEYKNLQTRPIKGTIVRGKEKNEDEQNKNLLLESKKDQAELFMIIDLLRNDLGKICEYGSVQVIERKILEAYKNVFHTVGIVEGKMKGGYDYWDAVKATFPGGSITGCPKIRSMEIIDELEKYTRNIYTGSIFLMNKEFFISSIIIRTAIITGNKFFLNSGGAITIDSKPETEYEEFLQKIRNFLDIAGDDIIL